MSNGLGTLSLSEQLKPYTSSLLRVMQEYEKVMVDISRTLPEIEEQIDDNVLEARELLSFINSTDEDHQEIGIKHEFQEFNKQLKSSIDVFRDIDQEDREIFTHIRGSIDQSLDTLEKVRIINLISEDLKVFAINSIVHSHNIGIQGRGYQMISSEFIKISGQIALKSQDIADLGKELEELINKDLLSRIDNQETFALKSIQSMSLESKDLLEAANSSLENFSKILADLLDRTSQVKGFIANVMMLLQKQDIIHQQLGHLHEAVEDILVIIQESSGSVDLSDIPETMEHKSILALLYFLVVSSEKQMSRVIEEIDIMVEETEVEFSTMQKSIGDIQADGESFSEVVVDTSLLSQGKSVMSRIFHEPKKMIDDLHKTLSYMVDQKSEVTLVYAQLVEKVQRERDYALAFLPMVESINNLLLLARIEKARYNLNITNLDNKDQGFSSESVLTLDGIVKEIEESYVNVKQHLSVSKSSQREQVDKVDTIYHVLKHSIEYIEKTEKLFQDNYLTIIEISNHLFKEVRQYIGLFDNIKVLNKTLKDNLKVCTNLGEQVKNIMEQAGGMMSLEDCHFKDVILQKIVKKCTVEKERDTLKEQFSELEIEESDKMDITLF